MIGILTSGIPLDAGHKLFATVMSELRAYLNIKAVCVKYEFNPSPVNTPHKIQIRSVSLVSSTYEAFSEFHNVLVDFGTERGVEEFQLCFESSLDGGDEQVIFRKVELVEPSE